MKMEALDPVLVGRMRIFDFIALTKPRLNLLVLFTTAVGYYLGSSGQIDHVILLQTLSGTALVAGAASVLNQFIERDLDGLMVRTASRPLPGGRVQPFEAKWFGIVLAVGGLLQLALGVGLVATAVAFVTISSYLVVYTPLKRRTPLSTAVGAVPGALPPMIGWAAARGSLEPAAWTLFATLFLWQMPHFLSIAWIYRDDYKRAGIPLLSVVEPEGRRTARQVVGYAVALFFASLAPEFVGLAGTLYFSGALFLGLAFSLLALRFARLRTITSARWLFIGSISYLPLLWGLLVADRIFGFGGS